MPLEPARAAEHRASAQAGSKSGESGRKTARTEAAPRAGKPFTAAGRLAGAGRPGDCRKQGDDARANAGGGDSASTGSRPFIKATEPRRAIAA